MSDLLVIDNTMIEEKRKELELLKPCDFEKGRIDQEMVEKLIPLLLIPFDEKSAEEGNSLREENKDIHYMLQLNRLQEVFGRTHVRKEYKVIEHDVANRERNADIHYYKVYVTIKIGNYTLYTDSATKPDTSFVSYYEESGLGWGSSEDKGIAEKNAIDDGIKDALKNMGMLRYLYLDEIEDNKGTKEEIKEEEIIEEIKEETKEEVIQEKDREAEIKEEDNLEQSNSTTTTIEFLEDPKISDVGTIFLIGLAKDHSNNNEIKVVLYQENKYNKDEHKIMIDTLKEHKQALKKGKMLNIEYKAGQYSGKPQYIINKVITTKKQNNVEKA